MQIVRQLVARGVIAALLMFSGTAIFQATSCFGQETLTRRVKTKIAPVYPDIARRMGISGTVKLSVVIATNGTVKNTTAVGGHPVLVNAAMDAVKKWKFEPAPGESTGTIEIKFAPEY